MHTERPEEWRPLDGGLAAWFDAPSLPAAAALLGRVTDLVGGRTAPEVALRSQGVRVRLRSDAPEHDAALARAVSSAASDLGLTADPGVLQTLGLGIATADAASVVPFWRTVLAYEPTPADALEDPVRRDPPVAFHGLEDERPLRNRIHVDVVRPSGAVAEVRSVTGATPYGVYGLTLADADGNEVDVVPGDALEDQPGTEDWRLLFGVMTHYPTASLAQASELATAAAGLADAAGVPLLVDVTADGVTFDGAKDQFVRPDGSVEPTFVDLARRLQAAAHDRGLSTDTARLRLVQVCVDAVDIPAVRAFWTAVLGYRPDPRSDVTDIYDPRRLNPVLMFQDLDAADEARRRQRNRIHVSLAVPADQAQARVDTAVAAGGTVVSTTGDRWLLTDPEGNELTVVSGPAQDHAAPARSS